MEKCIVVIENDDALREQIAQAFADLPCRIVQVATAADATMQVAVEGPDFVILAIDLPDGDGISILRGIRTLNEQLPIILISYHYSREMLVDIKASGVVDILLKPPDIERIKTKVIEKLWTSEELEAIKAGGMTVDEEEQEEEIGRALPKGAEMLNVNELVMGMRVACVVELHNVVYMEKGVVLTKEKIHNLTKAGVEDVCVYIDPYLKKRAPAPQPSHSEKKFHLYSAVKRSQIRVPVSIPITIEITNAKGVKEELKGMIVDISGGGGAILTKEKLGKDKELILNFALDDQIVFKDARAVVRYSMRRGTREFPFRTGIYFTSITEKFRENLVKRLFKIQQEHLKKGRGRLVDREFIEKVQE
ncbi:MAG: response regulator [bacterium]